MANCLAQAVGNDLGNWVKGTTFPAAPTTLYIALLTTVPTQNDGTGLVECSDGSYARQPVTSSSGWSTLTQSSDHLHQQLSNVGQITFPNVAGGAVTVLGLAVYSAVTSGTLLFYGAVNSQTVSTGNGYNINASQLILQF